MLKWPVNYGYISSGRPFHNYTLTNWTQIITGSYNMADVIRLQYGSHVSRIFYLQATN